MINSMVSDLRLRCENTIGFKTESHEEFEAWTTACKEALIKCNKVDRALNVLNFDKDTVKALITENESEQYMKALLLYLIYQWHNAYKTGRYDDRNEAICKWCDELYYDTVYQDCAWDDEISYDDKRMKAEAIYYVTYMHRYLQWCMKSVMEKLLSEYFSEYFEEMDNI